MIRKFFCCFAICFPVGLILTAQSLSDTIITLEGVEVKERAIQKMYPISVVSRDLMDRTSTVDLGEMLRMQPNVSGIRRGGYAVDPVVRGFRYSQVNIFLDEGIHIEGGCPNRMDPVLAHLSSEDVQSLEVIKGPYQLKYGTTLGSSIRVVSRIDNPFAKKKLQATLLSGYDENRNGFRQHLELLGSNSKSYYKVTGGYINFGNYTDGNGLEWKSGFKKYSINADAGFRLAPGHTLEISAKGSFARDVFFPALPMDENADNTSIFSVVYTLRPPGLTGRRIKVSAYHSRVYHEMDNSRRPQYSTVVPPYQGLMQAIAKVDTRSTGARIVWQHQRDKALIEGGLDLGHVYKDGNRNVKMIMNMGGQEFITKRTFNLWKDARNLNTGVFASFSSHDQPVQYSVTARADISHSGSGDTLLIEKDETIYYDARPLTHILWSLNTNASWQFAPKWKITLGLGRGARQPDLSELYIQFLATGFDRYDYLGNPELKPEVNYQADLMLAHTAGKMHFFTNLFRSDIRNFISGKLLPPAVARPQSMGAPGVKQFQNIDRAVFYGFESGLNTWLVPGLQTIFTVGYTYAYFPEIEKINLVNGQAVGTETLRNDPVPEIPALESQLKISHSLYNGRLEPSVEVRAVAPQKLGSEASYEEETPGYVVPSISVSWQVHKKIRVMAGVNNLFNKAYYDHLNRRIIGSNENFYEPGRTLWANLRIEI